MSAFFAIAAVLIVVALACVLIPLWGRPGGRMDIAREASNLAILRHQLAELEADRTGGTLSDDQYQQARTELERRVLDEAPRPAPAGVAAPRGVRWTAVVLGLALPSASVVLYLALGNLDALMRPTAGGDHTAAPEQVEVMVARLAARLEQQPDNAEGWNMLARSYYVLQRYPEAAKAYAKLIQLVPDNADLLADYADTLAMAQGRRIAGTPLEVVKRALKLDPNQWKALAMAGTEAFDRKDYRSAIAYWEKVERVAPADSDFTKSIGESIAQARELAGIKAPAAPVVAGASVKGMVTLSPALAGKADPSDTIFIFARATAGPRMPLAIVKRQVKDLPATFTLDDSQAMAPAMKLSNFPEVVVGARISKSANAAPQPGDLQGQSAPVKVGATNVAVVIDRVLP